MTVTSAFLQGVAAQLVEYGARLDESAGSIAAALAAADSGLSNLSSAWGGPRPEAVHGLVTGYLAEVSVVPAAITSARTTVARWTRAALDCAGAMATAEARIARLSFEAAQPEAPTESHRLLSQAMNEIDELDEAWRRQCHSFAEELHAAIAVIERANSTVVAESDASGLGGGSAQIDVGWIARQLLVLSPEDRAGALHALHALQGAWGGSAAALQLIVAAIEEVQRADQASWDAVVDAEGLPDGGAWWSNTDIEARYNIDQTEGGWYLIQLAHNAVGDDVVEQAGVFLAPGAVEGESEGEHTTDILLPVTVATAIAEGVPYMIAEVKPWRGGVGTGRKQLRIAKNWAEGQGAEVVYVGAPHPETGEPQLANPLFFANNEVEFPLFGSAELYPGMHVVYQLTEPGIYEYRMYVTEDQPDAFDPALDGSPTDFANQLRQDYLVSESDRPTQAAVLNGEGELDSLPTPRPGPVPRRFVTSAAAVS